MASGGIRMKTGSSVGTGASLDIRTLDFRPRKVVVENVAAGGLVRGEWQDTMADASMMKTAIDGAKTFPTTLGITPLSDGFRIGADTDLNVAGEVVHWVAYE